MWTRVAAGAVLSGLVALGVLCLYDPTKYREQPHPTPGSRIPALQQLVQQQEQESADAIAAYAPESPSRIDDLQAPAEDILRQLPGVVQVEVAVRAVKPTCRIVHLRDWHLVSRDLFAADMRTAAGRQLSDEQIDLLHQEHLLEVEAVQAEQMALLRCLIRHHGLRRIHCEGLTPQDLPAYQKRIAALRDIEKHQVPRLQQQREEVRQLLKDMAEAGRQEDERYKQALAIEKEIGGLLDQHRLQLLEFGAPGRLLITREIEEVLPLDDAILLEKAKPVAADGQVRLDPEPVKARQNAQVNSVLNSGPFALIVLGGAHDLTESVRMRVSGGCELIQVTTRRYREYAGLNRKLPR